MKKRFSMIAAVAGALLVGVTSCNRQVDEPKGEGSLKVSFDFASEDGEVGKAAVSTATPTTGWGNIKSLQLVLTKKGSDIVTFVQNLTVPSVGAESTSTTQVVNQIPAGTYDIYLIANNGASGNPMDPNAGSSTTGQPINRGTNIKTELVKLAAESSFVGMTETGIYKAPSELFMVKKSDQKIAGGDVTTDAGVLSLKRIVGLMRVLIDKSHSTATGVEFTHEKAYLRIRRHAIGWSYGNNAAEWAAGGKDKATVLVKRPFSAATTPGPGYGTGTIVNTTFTQWMDVMCLPGGSAATGADKFNIVIYGWAPANYILSDGSKLTAPGLVYWEGAVNAPLAANEILEIQAKITTPGTEAGTTPPDVTDFGNLAIKFSVTPWGTIKDTGLPL